MPIFPFENSIKNFIEIFAFLTLTRGLLLTYFDTWGPIVSRVQAGRVQIRWKKKLRGQGSNLPVEYKYIQHIRIRVSVNPCELKIPGYGLNPCGLKILP